MNSDQSDAGIGAQNITGTKISQCILQIPASRRGHTLNFSAEVPLHMETFSFPRGSGKITARPFGSKSSPQSKGHCRNVLIQHQNFWNSFKEKEKPNNNNRADIFFPLSCLFLFKRGFKAPGFGEHQGVVPPSSTQQVKKWGEKQIKGKSVF